jgi:histidine phosphotransferase ChpT
MPTLNLIGLLVSKVCHDLASPLGAMANGAELLAEESDADMQKQAIELIGQSSGQASARMNLFRLAFGAAGGQTPVGMDRLREVADAVLSSPRLSLDWSAVGGGDLPRVEARILLTLLLVGSQCLPRGGVLRVALPGGRIEVLASGAGARAPEGFIEILANRHGGLLESDGAVAGYAALAANAAGGQIACSAEIPIRLAFTRN